MGASPGGFWSALGQGVEQYGQHRKHQGIGTALLKAVGPQDANPYNPAMANNPNLATMPGDVATQPAPNTPASGVQSGPPQPQSMNSMIDPEASMQGAPDLSMGSSPVADTPDLSMGGGAAGAADDAAGGIGDAVAAFGGGKIVTQPTLAEVGDKGPEAVVPLTDQPGSKITPGQLGAGARTRWGHPGGPVASKRTAPIRGLLPVKPNAPFR
jgi:hypothetical protein